MAIMPDALLEFARSLKGGTDANSSVKQATVTRVDADGTVYVNIPGGEIETPVSNKSADVAVGDKVMVAARNGQLTIQGNYSKPSTDDTVANEARQMSSVALSNADAAAQAASIAQASADTAAAAAASAQTSANNAQTSATQANEYASRALGNLSTVQSVAETLTWIADHGTMALTTDTALDPTHVYFVQDANGDYVVNSVHYSIVSEPVVSALSTYYELSIDESLNNYVGTHLALTAEGLWLLPDSSGGFKILIATGSGTTYTTAGTYIIDSSSEVLAYFGAGGARIGNTTSGNYALIDSDSFDIYHTNTEMAHFGYGYGTNASGGTSLAPYYGLGIRKSGSTVGNYSIAEGYDSTASGFISHACGYLTTASGYGSYAFGQGSEASGQMSIAEGSGTTASGSDSHACGTNTTASGDSSFAVGDHTVTAYMNQFACGYYNENVNGHLFEVGNGYDGNRRNAFVVGSEGNVKAAGDIYAKGKQLNGYRVLWSGGYYMVASQTITLSENVSDQPTGILLVWSAYASGAVQNYNWCYTFVPKSHVARHSGTGTICQCFGPNFSDNCVKYVYVGDNWITGSSYNTATGTRNGVTFDANAFVLREVIGI